MPKAPKPPYETAAPPPPLEDDTERGDDGDLAYADKLFNAADLLRGAVAPYDYKYIVLGLIFLKYVSDAFEDRHETLRRQLRDERSDYYVEGASEEDMRAVAEDRDEYTSVNVFWVPPTARWTYIQAWGAQPDIGVIIDDAMRAIEAENAVLKGILFKNFAATQVAPHAYYELIGLVGAIGFGSAYARERDVLGRVYEYFIGRFAEAEGNAGGEFYTPRSVVKGKVERSVGVVKQGFWPGVAFTDLDDLNRQAAGWCDGLNRRVHRTTRRRPIDLHKEEGLRSLPPAFAWERFATEERRVSWDGFLSYDGVLYGLPSAAAAGGVVQVRERDGQLTVWQRGALVITLVKEPRSGEIVAHPDQFAHVLPAATARRRPRPLGHQVPAPVVAQRSAAQYDALYGVEVFA